MREGATENTASCKALLADLIERGLDPNRAILVVIDGAKALHKAVIETFGARVLIHRCHAHKKRNVTDALPERMRALVHSAMNQAYATRDPKRARRLLENLARRLESAHPGAAGSLREGLEETLTVMRLELPESLERVLSSTNLIENLFSRVRDTARRVKRWMGGLLPCIRSGAPNKNGSISKGWPKSKSHRKIRAFCLSLPWSRGKDRAGGRPKEVSRSSA